jgi:hypothetical protein
MFDSRVLETAIGIVFVFLGFSLITTAIQEVLASALKLRAGTLQSGLKAMLADGNKGLDFYQQVIGHPLVAPAGTSPSYVSASQFSAAVLHVLGNAQGVPAKVDSLRIAVANLPDAPYKQVLLGLFRDGETTIAGFERRLQDWFDQSMDRVSGIYKRLSQYITLAIGGLLAFVFQVNAIAIFYQLWNETPLREGAADAGGALKTMPQANQLAASLAQFHFLPIWMSPPAWDSGLFLWFVGCLVTAAAISLGAPFWFDLLQSFVSLRGTGPTPKKADGSS